MDSLYSGAQGDQNRCVLTIIHNALIIVSLARTAFLLFFETKKGNQDPNSFECWDFLRHETGWIYTISGSSSPNMLWKVGSEWFRNIQVCWHNLFHCLIASKTRHQSWQSWTPSFMHPHPREEQRTNARPAAVCFRSVMIYNYMSIIAYNLYMYILYNI